jgi:uncharacterized protein (TIGR01777 family)
VKVVVTGATGFIGSALVPALRARGDEVVVLSRDAERARTQLGVAAVTADLETRGAWGDTLAGAGAIVHLAGAPVADKRWDARQKQVIRDSRVESTRTIVEVIAALPAGERPGALISSSGVDYYAYASGPLDDDEVTEADPAADTFLGRVCRDWEAEARAVERLGVRVVCMRTGLVVGDGGPLAKLTTPFKIFAGGKLGNGKQWVSWIHLDDAVEAYVAAVHDVRFRGAINLVTASVRNRELAKALGKALGRPSWLPIPGFALKAAVGDFAEVILNGRMVMPTRLRELGFHWKHPALDDAVRDALGDRALGR